MINLLIIAYMITAVIAIWSKNNNQTIHYIFKPTVVGMLVFSLAFIVDDKYSLFIFIGLIFSLSGDVFIMLKKQKFIAGLISFFAAHIFYSLAFFTISDSIYFYYSIPIIIFAVLFYFVLSNGLGKLKIYVIAYEVVLVIMVFAAINLFRENLDLISVSVMLGGLLFLISDAALAYKKFVEDFPYSETIILGTYFISQFLFFNSTF